MNYEEYVADNIRYVNWFNNVFKVALLIALPWLRPEEVALSGSRSFDLAYPESDLEFAVILPVELHDVAPFVDFLNQFGKTSSFKTLAGLSLLTIEHPVFPIEMAPPEGVSLWKLEMTLRTAEQQQAIVNHIQTSLLTWSEEEKLNYVVRIQEAFHFMKTHPEDKEATQRYADCKKWLRVLPQKP